MSKKNEITKKSSQTKIKPPSPNDLLKIEIASELGLIDKVMSSGWKSLTSRESGQIGGIMAKKMREQAAVKNEIENNG